MVPKGPKICGVTTCRTSKAVYFRLPSTPRRISGSVAATGGDSTALPKVGDGGGERWGRQQRVVSCFMVHVWWTLRLLQCDVTPITHTPIWRNCAKVAAHVCLQKRSETLSPPIDGNASALSWALRCSSSPSRASVVLSALIAAFVVSARTRVGAMDRARPLWQAFRGFPAHPGEVEGEGRGERNAGRFGSTCLALRRWAGLLLFALVPCV